VTGNKDTGLVDSELNTRAVMSIASRDARRRIIKAGTTPVSDGNRIYCTRDYTCARSVSSGASMARRHRLRGRGEKRQGIYTRASVSSPCREPGPYVPRTKIADVFSLACTCTRCLASSFSLSLSLSLSGKELHPRAILRPLRFNTLVAGRHREQQRDPVMFYSEHRALNVCTCTAGIA